MDEMGKTETDMVRRVLVVEDDSILRNLIVKTLKRAGYVTCDAPDGAEAVKCALSDPYLVLLLDQKLPDMEGSDIVRILGEKGIKASFIMMTGHGDERLAVEMMKRGAADYLIKDTGFIDLLPGVLDRVFKNIETEKKLKTAEEEKEKLQAQLYQAQKLESVGRLAGGVAHDFNNMLGVILGNAELAIDQIEENTPLFDYLQDIIKAAERSVDLTQQLLAFARKQTIVPKLLNLNMAVDKMLKMLIRLIGENIELVWVPSNAAGTVKMDPSQIDQILANLCVNARDAIGDHGKIIIKSEVLTLCQNNSSENTGIVPSDYILLSVCDNGCGMDMETQSQIFEPFFTTKEMGKGTGLGLATVYGIVKQNNGFIDIDSEPGHGTTFKIYLPSYASGATPILEKDEAKPPLRGHETVLLVEDEKSFLNIIKIMLTKLGYHVLCASSPDEAIGMAKGHTDKIDLILTDVIMPGMNGYELSRKIIDFYPGIKCLLMSGYTSNIISEYCLPDDRIVIIKKPFSIKDLASKVKEALVAY